MAILTTTTTTTAPSLTINDGSSIAWIGGTDKSSLADMLDEYLTTPAFLREGESIIELKATARLNRTSLASPNKGVVMARLKRKLLKNLFNDLVGANVISIHSAPTKTGGMTFNATIKVVERDAKEPNDKP